MACMGAFSDTMMSGLRVGPTSDFDVGGACDVDDLFMDSEVTTEAQVVLPWLFWLEVGILLAAFLDA